MDFYVAGQVVDVHMGKIFPAEIYVVDGRVRLIRPVRRAPKHLIMPGLIDAHVHIESSMLTPPEFARMAVAHGTVGTVSDPHEIGNVLGRDGVLYMVKEGRRSPFKFSWGAPSCVPASGFESSGAVITPQDVQHLLEHGCTFLSEVMNFPGVLSGDPDMLAKLEIARQMGVPIDGHAPGLQGEGARCYIAAGPSTDHEVYNLEDARERVRLGMKILIREGSAARNFDELQPLLAEAPEMCMFCADDMHPDELRRGHINQLVHRALLLGHNPIAVIRAATLNPVTHYRMPIGLLRQGDPADFIVVDGLETFRILDTFINGEHVWDGEKCLLPRLESPVVNHFNHRRISESHIRVPLTGSGVVRAIGVADGSLFTEEIKVRPATADGALISDPRTDILKIVVLNRYDPRARPSVGFVSGFGLKAGALASSVGHDSHNIIAIGVTDEDLVEAINTVIDFQGCMVCIAPNPDIAVRLMKMVLPLPIAGIISDAEGCDVADDYESIDGMAKSLGGCGLRAPFMAMSFPALTVIPQLKLSDQGLFSAESWGFVPLQL